MSADNGSIHQITGDRFALAFDALAQISDLEKGWLDTENEVTASRLLSESGKLFDQAIDIFIKENEPVMAAWAMLQKASIMADMAGSADQANHPDLARQALEQAGNGLQLIPDDHPPDLKTIIRLYTSLIEILVKIRALLNEPERVKALDALIRGFSAHFGEVQAWDFSTRSKANDLLFTAGVLETLGEIEKDPGQHKQLIEASKDLGLQAQQQLQFSTAEDLTHVTALLQRLEQKLMQNADPEGQICIQCGTEYPPGRSICSQCGTQLNKEA